MERQEFLSALEKRLVELGMDEARAASYVSAIGGQMEKKDIRSVSFNVDEFAEQMIKRCEAAPEGEEPTDTEIPIPVSEEILPDEAEAIEPSTAAEPTSENDETETTDAVSELSNEADEQIAFDETAEEVADEQEGTGEPANADESADTVDDHNNANDIETENEEENKTTDMAKKKKQHDSESGFDEDLAQFRPDGKRKYTTKEKIEQYKSQSVKGKILYWIVTVIGLPVLVALEAMFTIAYILLWIGLTLAMIALTVALIGFVAVGSVIVLVGIVYGVVQIVLSNTAIGLFELGLGITIGGIVMLIGILVYNLIFRLIPFAIKMLTKLIGFLYRKGGELFGSLKGVCKKI